MGGKLVEHQHSSKAGPPTGKAGRRSQRSRFALGTIEGPALSLDEPAHDGAGGGMREGAVAEFAHDLRDPLGAIALDADILERRLVGEEAADARRAAARILRNVEFLDRLIHDLLDSCALGDGHLELHRQPTELSALLERIVARIGSTRDRGRVILDVLPRTTLSIDELRIERVIANLIGNALKHTPPGSRIVVRLEVGASSAQISVTDTGPGIAAAELGFIFDRYRRGASAAPGRGCGLGLYVSKKIVEAHGGRIGVESVVGVGSCFYFELPLSPG
jgi:two-component system, NtrC family, sensor histidine kinase KinB